MLFILMPNKEMDENMQEFGSDDDEICIDKIITH